MPDQDWGRHSWRGRGGWGDGQRPRWWPEGEPWPPEGPEAWRHLRSRFMRRMALFALIPLAFLVTLAGLAIWAISSILGPGGPGFLGPLLVFVLFVLAARFIVRGFRRSTMPIGDMMEAAGRIEAGDFSAKVRETGPSDVRRLARAFNDMSARLATDAAERRQLLADVSHELRTPLSVIQGNVEGILDGLYPADRAHLEPILEETQLLERLVEDLRTLSLSESGALRLHREPTDLGSLLAETVAGFRARVDAAGIELALSADESLPTLELDQARLRQVIGNLLANALRFTPVGGSIRVAVAAADDGGAEISVADTGSGIAADELPHIFDRFYRSADSGGSGLGLPIARSLIEAHGGTIDAESASGAGTTVRIRLPAPSPVES